MKRKQANCLKRIQNNDSKDDQNPENSMEKMQESINRHLEKLKN